MKTAALAAVITCFLVGCSGDDPASGANDAASDVGGDEGLDVASDAAAETPETIPFGICPAGYSGACAILDAPLDHAAKGGKTVHVLVNRLATSPKATAQLWMLAGGPGGSASDLTQTGLKLARALDGFDVYLLEHRGVGGSDRLLCKLPPESPTPPTKAEVDAYWAKCGEELSARWPDGGLNKFSTTQAAHDLGFAIDRVRKPGQQVFVYGVSYGTYWAQRYLQVRGDQPDGVVLDSIFSPGVQYMTAADEQLDFAGKKLADLCKADPFCTSKLGADPWATVQSLAAKVKARSCVGAPEPEAVFGAVQAFLQQWGLNALAFSILHRYGRCTANDVAALKQLESVLNKGASEPRPRFSQALFFNVAFSELWESPSPTEAALKARADAAVLPVNIWNLKALEALWPKYERDSHVGKFPVTTKPVLVLNGELDAQTTMKTAIAAKAVYAGAKQAFIEVPGANHSVLTASPLKDPAKPHCGEQIITAWLKAPTNAPSTACFKDMAQLSFEGDPGLVNFLYGRPSAWDE